MFCNVLIEDDSVFENVLKANYRPINRFNRILVMSWFYG